MSFDIAAAHHYAIGDPGSGSPRRNHEGCVEWTRHEFAISTDPSRLDVEMIHGFLRESYWAENIPRSVVERSISGSLAFGLYHSGSQIGFARVITDCATFAYVADVFIDAAYRNRGLAEWLMSSVMAHPGVQGLRRWMLITRDAHGLYRKFGFENPTNPIAVMERHDPNVYQGIEGQACPK